MTQMIGLGCHAVSVSVINQKGACGDVVVSLLVKNVPIFFTPKFKTFLFVRGVEWRFRNRGA
jgi:hypothetical protein